MNRSLLIALSVVLVASSAQAAKKAESVAEQSAASKIGLEFWGRISGPTVSFERVKNNVASWYQEIDLVYKAGTFTPFIKNRFSTNFGDQSSFSLINPRVGTYVSAINLLKSNKADLMLAGNRLDLELPATANSRDLGMILAPSFETSLILAFKEAPISLGYTLEYRHAFLKQDAPAIPGPSLESAPRDGDLSQKVWAKYKFSDKLTTYLRYETNAFHVYGDATDVFVDDGDLFRLRFNITAIPNHLTVAPFAAWSVGSQAKTTQMGFEISGGI